MKFEWDNDKEQINIKKHGISFKEALQVFLDSNSIEIFDEAHSDENEERYKVIGLLSSRLIIISLIYTERREVLRIISARKANKEEKEAYEKQT